MRALAALLWLTATAAHAQTGGEDLGDTGAPPPSAEDLGKTPEEPPPAEATPEAGVPEATPQPKKRKAPAADAGMAPAAAAAAAPSAEQAQKIAKLKADLDAGLRAEPGDGRALEALAQTWFADSVLAGDAELRALLKLARGRSLLLQRRFDESLDALTDARQAAETLPGPTQRPLVAQVKFRVAEIEEARESAAERCGQALGLKRLAKLEGEEARKRVEAVAQKYQVAVKLGDRFWA
ncbi:MAG: hypothetical protein IT382_22335, partial [Deltaproteobacteria bacterium]|nr:hypothetical protein [Deltaproteobacteria bacterium]